MSSSYVVPLQITMTRLPPGFKGTPQELADAIAAGLAVVTTAPFALFRSGSTEPDSDQGPWAKDGNQWRFFDTTVGGYVDFLLSDARRKWVASVSEPTDEEITLWVVVDESTGQPIDIRWRTAAETDPFVSIYYPKSEVYTKAEIDTIVADAPKAARYAVRADNVGSQTIPIRTISTPTKLTFDNEIFDPNSAYSSADSRYTAPVSGIYAVSIITQFDNDGGVAANMQIGVFLAKNGLGGGNILGSTTAVASPPGARWFVNFSGLVSLNAGEYFDVAVYADDGTNTADLQAGGRSLSVNLVQQTA